MQRKLIRTADGSHTFFVKELKEHYHSVNGAIGESSHVFIDAGFRKVAIRGSMSILEVGFGTGLNALLTVMANSTTRIEIEYTGLEAFPLTLKEAELLNYTELLDAPEMRLVLMHMHQCDWEKPVPVHKGFTLSKLRVSLEEYRCTHPKYDLVYFDAFAPDVQPELWTTEIFSNLFQCMKTNGVLVTYCAKGSVKRAMKAAGFTIEKLPGPSGKREMTRAVKL